MENTKIETTKKTLDLSKYKLEALPFSLNKDLEAEIVMLGVSPGTVESGTGLSFRPTCSIWFNKPAYGVSVTCSADSGPAGTNTSHIEVNGSIHGGTEHFDDVTFINCDFLAEVIEGQAGENVQINFEITWFGGSHYATSGPVYIGF